MLPTAQDRLAIDRSYRRYLGPFFPVARPPLPAASIRLPNAGTLLRDFTANTPSRPHDAEPPKPFYRRKHLLTKPGNDANVPKAHSLPKRGSIIVVAQEFKEQVLQQFYQDMHVTVKDNYSFERFSFDGIDRSGFDASRHALYLDWFVRRYEDVFRTYMTLRDQASRDLYLNVLRFKLAGHSHVRIDNHVGRLGSEMKRFAEIFAGTPSDLSVSGMFGSLLHYNGEWNGVRYTIDTMKNSLAETLVLRQYFFERGGLRIAPEPGDYVIDGGACTGETAIVFSRSVGATGHVYAFDPVQDHVEICTHNISRPEYRNVTLLGYGLSDHTVERPPVKLGQYSPGWRADPDATPLCRIDDFVIDGRIAKVDFIKFDIEGSEMHALRGALATLNRYRPKLAISIYHNPDDYFEICNFLNDQKLGYAFYLDHYTIHAEETVLYACC